MNNDRRGIRPPGYVYVATFSDGSFKIGVSAVDVRRRVREAARRALRARGVTLAEEWVSPLLPDPYATEQRMIQWLTVHARPLGHGRVNEVFADVSSAYVILRLLDSIMTHDLDPLTL